MERDFFFGTSPIRRERLQYKRDTQADQTTAPALFCVQNGSTGEESPLSIEQRCWLTARRRKLPDSATEKCIATFVRKYAVARVKRRGKSAPRPW